MFKSANHDIGELEENDLCTQIKIIQKLFMLTAQFGDIKFGEKFN